VWHSETDPHASLVLQTRWPGVPNHGDLTVADWSKVEPVDALVAGFPCQPVSQAGKQKAQHDVRWVWDDIIAAVGNMAARPGLLFFENVRGLLTAGGGSAMRDVVHGLAHLGYVGRYGCFKASDVGAPHRRERVFIVAELADTDGTRPKGSQSAQRQFVSDGGAAADTFDGADLGVYQPAVDRWVAVLGRPAPPPVIDLARAAEPVNRPRQREGKRLNPVFVEWMMGLPDGWVSDLVPRRPALRILGNGAVPLQAYTAYGRLLDG
jgi:DNA (cytosine-5)-methyltransferase 1